MMKKNKIVALILAIAVFMCNIPDINISALASNYIDTIVISDVADNTDDGLGLTYEKTFKNQVDVDLKGRIRHSEQGYMINVKLTLPDNFYDENSMEPDKNKISVSVNGNNTEFEKENHYQTDNTASSGNVTSAGSTGSQGQLSRNYPVVCMQMELREPTKRYEIVINWTDSYSVTYVLHTDNLIFENVIQDMEDNYYYELPDDVLCDLSAYQDNLGNQLVVNSIYADGKELNREDGTYCIEDNRLKISSNYIKKYYDETGKGSCGLLIRLRNENGIVASFYLNIKIDLTPSCHVSFYWNDEDVEKGVICAENTVLAGSRLNFAPDVPSLPNYIFKGWREYDSQDILDLAEYTVNGGAKKLVAVWEMDTAGKIQTGSYVTVNGKKYYKDEAVLSPTVEGWKICKGDELFDSVVLKDNSEKIEFRLTDSAGKQSDIISYELDGYIDTEAPEIALYHVEDSLRDDANTMNEIYAVNSVFRVKITDTDSFYAPEEREQGNTLVAFKINGRQIDNYIYNPDKASYVLEYPIEVGENYHVEVTAKDRVGHETTSSYELKGVNTPIRMDKYICRNGEVYDKEYIVYSDDADETYTLVVIPVSANGMEKHWTYSYQIDNQNEVSVKGLLFQNKVIAIPLKNMEDGIHTIQVTAASSKIVKPLKFVFTIYVDNEAPTIEPEKTYNKDYYLEEDEGLSFRYYDVNGVGKADIRLYRYHEDSASEDKYELVNEIHKENIENAIEGKIEIFQNNCPGDGRYKLVITAVDTLGLESEAQTFYFNIDKLPPQLISYQRVNIDEKPNKPDMDFVNIDFEVELEIQDNLSGVQWVRYSDKGYDYHLEEDDAEYRNGKYYIKVNTEEGKTVNKELYITFCDKQGNWNYLSEKIVIKTDKERPEVTDIRLSTEEYTNENITLYADVSDNMGSGVDKIEWSKDNGQTYEDISGSYKDGKIETVVEQSGEYKIKVTDKVGNVDEDSIFIKNIDKFVPDITDIKVQIDENHPQWKTSEATIQVIAKDEGTSCLKELCWRVEDNHGNVIEGLRSSKNFEKDSAEAELTFDIQELDKRLEDGIYKVSAYVTDYAGNKSDVQTTDLYIDNTAPDLTWDKTEPHRINGEYWYGKSDLKRDFKIKVKVSDVLSGIDDRNIELYINQQKVSSDGYTIQGDNHDKVIHIRPGEWKQSEGTYQIEVRVTDNTLRYSNSIKTKFHVDNTNPKITAFYMNVSGNQGYIDGDGSIVKDNTYGYYFKKPATIYIYAKDDETSAGIESITYFLCAKGQSYESALQNAVSKNVDGENKISVSIPEGFKGEIYAAATDKLDNQSLFYVKPQAIIIDNHKQDTEAITITRPETSLKDNQGVDLYNTDVPVKIDIKDVTSGIREVTWKVESVHDASNNYEGSISIDNSGRITGDSMNVVTVEENLKTMLHKELIVRNNDNQVKVTVTMMDRAGNVSTSTNVFSIDKTSPTVTISYDNNSPDTGNQEYFNRDRIATITVRERNFNADDIKLQVTNSEGSIPALSDWTVINGTGNGDDTLYRATLHYANDGDYTFAVSYHDNAGNLAANSYVQGTVSPEKFTIDKTNPVLAVQYNNSSAANGNYYLDEQTATITVVEHNFSEDRLELAVTKNGNPVIPSVHWVNIGDTHIMNILLNEEALYNIRVYYMDMAGNTVNAAYSSEFYIDRNNPELTIQGVEDRRPYTDETVAIHISASDIYFDDMRLNLSLVKADGTELKIISNNVMQTDDVELTVSDITNGKQLSIANLVSDGIYKLSCSAMDKAGRKVEKELLFSVNRKGPTYFIEDNHTLSIKDKYLKAPQDIIISEMNVNQLSVGTIKVTVFRGNHTYDLVEGVDYTIEKVEAEDSWCAYRYMIKKENFVENGIYHVSITSKDKADNDAISERFSFIIDNEAPLCNLFDLENGKVYVGDSKNIRFKLTDNIALASVRVLLNDREILSLEGEDLEKALEMENVISFIVNSSNSSQDLIINYTDMAGNEGQIEVHNFYVTKSMWIRFITNMPLVIAVCGLTLLLLGFFIFLIIRKRKN